MKCPHPGPQVLDVLSTLSLTSSSPSFSSPSSWFSSSSPSPSSPSPSSSFSATRIQQLRLLTRRTRIIKAELLTVSCKAIQVNCRRMLVFLSYLMTASTTQSRLSIPPIQRPAAATEQSSSYLRFLYFITYRYIVVMWHYSSANLRQLQRYRAIIHGCLHWLLDLLWDWVGYPSHAR